MNEQRYQALLENADQLERQAEIVRNVAGNLRALRNEDESYVLDDENRLFVNSERFHFFHPAMLWNIRERGKLMIDDKWRVVSGFAYLGDELCSRMMDYFNTLPSHSTGQLILNRTRIAEKLLTRTMKKKEYKGYLNGEIPISGLKGDGHYLPSNKVLAS